MLLWCRYTALVMDSRRSRTGGELCGGRECGGGTEVCSVSVFVNVIILLSNWFVTEQGSQMP